MDIDLLIVAELAATATAEERAHLAEWRQASAANEAHYREVARLWRAMGSIPSPEPISAPPTPHAVIRRAGLQNGGPASDAAHRWWRIGQRGVLAAAALSLLAIGVTWFWSHRASQTVLATEFVTGSAEMSTVRLPDGTVVRLAPRTRLEVDGKGQGREVYLEGRAFFAVRHAQGRTFRVRTHAGDVTVLGTRFDLQSQQSDMRLTVLEGRVSLATASKDVTVNAGEMTQILDGVTIAPVKVLDIRGEMSWLAGFLAFQATPLWQAGEEIALQYGVRVNIPDLNLRQRTVTAWFTDRPLAEVLRVVCSAVVAECSNSDGVVTMRPRR